MREIARAMMAGIDDRRLARGRAVRSRADEEMRHGGDRILRRRQADARSLVAAERGEPLQRQREMRAALVGRDGVDLVDDDGARRRQRLAARFRAEQHIERFRRGHENMRRALAHALALGGGRVAGAHQRANLDIGQAQQSRSFSRTPASGASRLRLMSLDKRLERRHIDDAGLVRERPSSPRRTRSSIAARKAASVLPEPVGRGDQNISSGFDFWPSFRLRRRRIAEMIGEPCRNRRMKKVRQMHGHEERREPRGKIRLAAFGSRANGEIWESSPDAATRRAAASAIFRAGREAAARGERTIPPSRREDVHAQQIHRHVVASLCRLRHSRRVLVRRFRFRRQAGRPNIATCGSSSANSGSSTSILDRAPRGGIRRSAAIC